MPQNELQESTIKMSAAVFLLEVPEKSHFLALPNSGGCLLFLALGALPPPSKHILLLLLSVTLAFPTSFLGGFLSSY